jgi:hypothetical protein
VYAHDWRVDTFDAWWQRQAEFSIAVDETFEPVAARPSNALVVLAETEFAESVRRALRDYHEVAALAGNPLLRSRVALDAVGREPGPPDLQALLRQSIEVLSRSERSEKFYRALWHTYIQPAASQERVAERLGLPFSTYRYHLARGTEQIVDLLWRRELHGAISGGADRV